MASLPSQSPQHMVCGYIRPPIAEAILVILMGLTAKTALDQVFVSIPHLDGLKAIWVRLASDPVWHICLVCQAIVFFITAFRFYLGSLRYHQMRGGQFSRFRSLLWDVLGTLIIFVGFYVSALSLRSRGNFYPFIFILHICDATWFGGAWLIDVTPPAQQVLMKRFILLDLATVFGIGVSALAVWVFHFGFGSPFIFHWLCFSVLLIIGSVDFYLNNLFYFKGTV